MLAVGKHYLGNLTERDIRMSTAFAGGLGCTYQENCGVLSTGMMIIGALTGRTTADQDDQVCQDLAALYLERFTKYFDTANCGQLRETRYGSGGAEPCSVLVERGAGILIQVIDDYQEKKLTDPKKEE